MRMPPFNDSNVAGEHWVAARVALHPSCAAHLPRYAAYTRRSRSSCCVVTASPTPAVEPSPIAAATPRTPQQFCSISNINYYFNSDGKNNNIINQVILAGVLGWVLSWLGFDGCCKSGCYDLVVSIVQSLRRTEWFVLYYVVVRYV